MKRTRLERRTPLRRVSRKRAQENRQRRKMASRRYGPDRPLCVWPGPPHWADAFNEALTRARGGSITSEANTHPMCNLHNGMLASTPDSELGWAYAIGLIRHSWEAVP